MRRVSSRVLTKFGRFQSAQLCAFSIIAAVLGSCGHPRPALLGNIDIHAERLSANLNQDPVDKGPGAVQHAASADFLASVAALRQVSGSGNQTICRALLDKDISGNASTSVEPGHAIVLSGGSQHGAFGAGFLVGLQDKEQLPPEPTIVTGVSTGSLQATFVFLAREPVAKDRRYDWLDRKVPTLEQLPGADHEPPLAAGRSNLQDLALAYSITREKEILRGSPVGGADLLFKGALATLSPLRRRLMALITPDTIQQVATEACRGRTLLVGAADVDDGNGYALDLTALALSAFDGHASDDRMMRVRNTYVSALLASSSVPVGAMPVTLRYREVGRDGSFAELDSRQHIFIDGGARFGVFLPAIADDYDVTLLVNTTLTTDPWIKGNPPRPTSRWLLLKLVPRTVEDILETQVYQLSVGKIETGAQRLKMAYISNDRLHDRSGQPAEGPLDHRYRDRTCAAWKDADAERNPIQFSPNYMACLIDYGRSRGNLQQWNLITPSTGPAGHAGTTDPKNVPRHSRQVAQATE